MARFDDADSLIKAARADAEDRQRALDEICRRVLKDFVGCVATPNLIAAVEGAMRAALSDAVRAGTYVLPEGLELGHVEVGADMRIKVLFNRTPPALAAQRDALAYLRAKLVPTFDEIVPDKPRDRFTAVAEEMLDNPPRGEET